MSLENPNVSATGMVPITLAVPPSTGISSIIPRRVVTSLVTPPITSFGASMRIFWIGSKITDLDLISAVSYTHLTLPTIYSV